MRKLSVYLFTAFIVLAIATIATAVTMNFPSGVAVYSDRDGNVRKADTNGQGDIPAKYVNDATTAGFTPTPSAYTLATFSSNTSQGACTKGTIKYSPSLVMICYSSKTATGWKKSDLR